MASMNTYSARPASPPRTPWTLWLARDLTTVGNWVVLVALLAWTYRVNESARDIAVLIVAWVLLTALLRPVAGSLISVGNARFVGAAAQPLRAAALVPLLGVGADGQASTAQIVALLTMALAAFVHAAHTALLPSLVSPERLDLARMRLLATRLLAMAAGSAAGVFVFRAAELRGAAVAGGAAFLLSAILTLLVKSRADGAGSYGTKNSPAESFAGAARGVLHALVNPATQMAAVILLLLSALAGGIVVAETAYTTWGLFVQNENIGFILAGQGAGLLIALLIYRQAWFRLRASTSVATGLIVTAIAEFGFILAAEVPIAVAFSGIVGAGKGLALLGLATALAEAGAAPYMTRGLQMAAGIGVALSALLIGSMVETVTPRLAIAMVCGALMVLALYAFGAIEDPETEKEAETGQVAEASISSLLPD